MSVFVATYRRTCPYCQYEPADKQARHCAVCGKSLRVWRGSFYGNAVASGVTGLFGIAFLVGYWLTAPVGTWSTTNDPSVPLSVSLLVLGIIAAVISVVCGFFAIVSPLKEARDVAEDKDMKTAEIKTQAGNVIRLAVIGKKVVLTLTKPGVGGVEVYNAFLDEAVLLRHCQGEEEAREI